MTEKIPDAVFGALQGSGFPFQTLVAHVVNQTARAWEIVKPEYPWESADGEGQFLDLVAKNAHGTLFLTIECKKTRKEKFIFLRPLGQGNTGDELDFRCLAASRVDSERRVEIYCEEWGLYPKSYCSEFCVVSTSAAGRDQRLLEKDAGLLIGATDAYADDFRTSSTPETSVPAPACLFVPVIVTNATIYTTRYEPKEVSLETGEFTRLPKETESVPWVRFRKAFTSRGQLDMGDRSVFVVNASSFSTFLSNLQAEAKQPYARMQVRLRKLPR